MKKNQTIAAMILASGMSAFGQGATPAPSLSKLEALAKQTTPPAVHEGTGFQADGAVRPLFFDALDWEGKPTRAFAWIGLPAGASKEKPAPGIVLVHGGGGTAYTDWVKEWNEQGFAAISIAVEGQTEQKGQSGAKWQRHEHGGPARSGTYSDFTKPIEDQWMYHAVADTILARRGSAPRVMHLQNRSCRMASHGASPNPRRSMAGRSPPSSNRKTENGSPPPPSLKVRPPAS